MPGLAAVCPTFQNWYCDSGNGQQAMSGIFINYRRDDVPDAAGRLADRLASNCSPRKIFMDVDAIKPGLDFEQLDARVLKSVVVLAIIGPNWLNAGDGRGQRKLDVPRDYVRLELASALKRKIPVIPVLVNGAAMPLEHELPEDLKSLVKRQALELRRTRFAADSDAIIKALNVRMLRPPKWRQIAAGAGFAAAGVLAGIVVWAVHNDSYPVGPAAKPVPIQESRTQTLPNPPTPPAATAATSIPSTSPTKSLSVVPNAVVPNAGSPTGHKRVALVVGNSTYEAVPQLSTPASDATAMGKLFTDAGFDSVDVQLNVSYAEFKRAIRKFHDVADVAEMAVVYYAGHGLELAGINYLIPIDARLATDRDVEDEAIPLDRLVASADGAALLHVVILDASRDNPFVKTMRRDRKFSGSVSSGLAKIEPSSTDTLIAYAAKAGSIASGDGTQSPYTAALLKSLTVPGLDVRLAFGRIRDEVMKASGGKQEPFVYGSLGGNNLSLVPPPIVSQETPVDETRGDYEVVAKVGTVKAWQTFLGSHPTGFYSDLARAQLDRLANPAPKAR
jgi:hypothetical protein